MSRSLEIRPVRGRLLREEMVVARLASGLRAVVYPKPGLLKKAAVVSTRYGSIDLVFSPDPGAPPQPTPAGIAHFLEHQLFKKPDMDVLMEFGRYGASSNAFTDYTSTTYYFSGTDHFDSCLDLLLRLVFSPHFSADGVAREKLIIEQELRMYDDMPDHRIYRNLMSALYREHPVRIDIGGTVETIQRIDHGLLERCYRRFYHPANMWFAASGDLEPRRVLERIDRALPPDRFGSGGAAIERRYPGEGPEPARPLVREAGIVSRPRVIVGFKDLDREPSRLLDRDLATSVLLDLMFGPTSRFHARWYREGLIDETFSASCHVDHSFGFTLIGGETDEPQKLVEEIRREVRRYSGSRLKTRDVYRARRSRLGRYVRTFDSPEGVAFFVLGCMMRDIDPFAIPAALKRLTSRALERRMREHLREDRCAVSIIDPVPAAAAKGA